MGWKQPNHIALACHVGVVVLAATAARAQDGGTILLDRAVASIEGKVITLTQLDFEARVLLINAGAVRAAFGPLDAEVLRTSLTAILDQRLATLEADKLDAYPVDPPALERAIVAFRERFDSEATFRRFLDTHEADLADVEAVLQRGLRAERALDAKLRLRASVSERDARAYQAQHPEVASMSVEQLRERLTAQRFAQLVREELDRQRRNASVHLLGPFSPPLEGSK